MYYVDKIATILNNTTCSSIIVQPTQARMDALDGQIKFLQGQVAQVEQRKNKIMGQVSLLSRVSDVREEQLYKLKYVDSVP